MAANDPAPDSVESSMPEFDSDVEYEEFVADFLSPRPIERVGIVLFACIMIVGVCGNCLVILVVASAKNMRTSMNVLLMNLAIADLIILLICLPTTVANDVTKTFWFSAAACKGVLFVQNTGVYVAVLSLTFISYERWRAVTSPLDSVFNSRYIVVACIWTISMFLSLPEPITVEIRPANFMRINFTTTWGTQCIPSWSPHVEQTYQLIQTVVFYVLPLLIISYLCHSTIRTLNSPDIKKAFGSDAADMDVDVDLSALRKLLARFFSYSSSCLNPILYNILSRKFRKEYTRLVLCQRRRYMVPGHSPGAHPMLGMAAGAGPAGT